MINKIKNKDTLKGVLKSVRSRAVAVIALLVIFATSVFAAFNVTYVVDIVDDGATSQTATTRSEPMDIIAQMGINLDASDKIDLTDFQSGKGGKIVINRSKDINVQYCDVINNYEVYALTVKDAVAEVGITLPERYTINYDLNDKVTDGMVVSIVIPDPVTVTADGISTAAPANGGNVAELLNARGIQLGEHDIVNPALETPVTAGLSVSINRVTYTEIEEVHGMPFSTSTRRVTSIPAGTTQVQTEGVNGVKQVRFKVKLVDGVETERALAGETITQKPVAKVILSGVQRKTATPQTTAPATTENQGTVSNPARMYNGIYEGQVIGGNATHYCACSICNGSYGGTTTSGIKIQNGMANPYIVACNWLPIGTKIRVNGVLYTVSDRGGSGLSPVGRVDIFTPEGHAACKRLGRKNITIEIVQLSKTK